MGGLVIQGGLQRRWLREHIALPEGGSQRTRWQRLGMALAAALIVLALLMAVLSSLANGGAAGDVRQRCDHHAQPGPASHR